jgi:hypothetical protein
MARKHRESDESCDTRIPSSSPYYSILAPRLLDDTTQVFPSFVNLPENALIDTPRNVLYKSP